VAGISVVTAALLSAVGLPEQARADWIAVWTAAPFPAIRKLIDRDARSFADQTLRQSLRVAAPGERLRLRLTNELGAAATAFGEVHVAISGPDGRPKPGTDRIVLFSGRPDGRIPAGAPLLSDAIRLPVRAGETLAVSVYYRAPATPAAHLLEGELAPGNQASAPVLTNARRVRAPALAAAVEVWRNKQTPVIVAFGDSITEGDGSTPGAHRDWPSQLSRRLHARPVTRGWSVVNAGINGTRILREGAGRSALARFDRDALAVAGVTHIVLLEGINDIGWGSQPDRPQDHVEADALIAAYRQLIGRAHARKVRICGGTLLPYRLSLYWTAEGERKRQAVNAWIRTSRAFDCVIDFERPVADPADASAIAPGRHRGDHLHPNDAGYAAMAKAAEQALRGD
jgi:lysophospholipase L1-like esterase